MQRRSSNSGEVGRSWAAKWTAKWTKANKIQDQQARTQIEGCSSSQPSPSLSCLFTVRLAMLCSSISTALLPIRQARLSAPSTSQCSPRKILPGRALSSVLADVRFCWHQERPGEAPNQRQAGSWREARTTAPLVQEQPARAWRARPRLGRPGCAWGRASFAPSQCRGLTPAGANT